MGFWDGCGISWTMCISLQTDNHTNTPSLSFYRFGDIVSVKTHLHRGNKVVNVVNWQHVYLSSFLLRRCEWAFIVIIIVVKHLNNVYCLLVAGSRVCRTRFKPEEGHQRRVRCRISTPCIPKEIANFNIAGGANIIEPLTMHYLYQKVLWTSAEVFWRHVQSGIVSLTLII